jgi:hypothetical protein
MRLKARGMSQHCGSLGWLEESDPAGFDLVRYGWSMPPALTDHTTCPDLLLNVHKTSSRAMSRKEGMAWYSSRPMPSLWQTTLCCFSPSIRCVWNCCAMVQRKTFLTQGFCFRPLSHFLNYDVIPLPPQFVIIIALTLKYSSSCGVDKVQKMKINHPIDNNNNCISIFSFLILIKMLLSWAYL